MELVADILMAGGAFGAAGYCYILSARLKNFATLESGMGGAIAVLSAQVDDMTRALEQARGAANGSVAGLEQSTSRAEHVAARIELLLASMHDLPEPGATPMDTEAAETTERKLRFVRRRSARDEMEAAG